MSKPKIEGIYPLTFSQEALLFHNLFAKSTQLGFIQVCYTLEGKLDNELLLASWQWVIDRHQVLRTSIHWKEIDKPVQVVYQTRKPPISEADWTEIPLSDHQALLEEELQEDNQKGYDFTKAPLMRMKLIRAKENLHYLIWSAHHILLDGWSWSLLFREAFQQYRALQSGTAIQASAVRPFSDYISWLNNQDIKPAENFWKKKLSGLGPTPLSDHLQNGQPIQTNSVTVYLPKSKGEAYTTFVKNHRLTLNTLMQGAWSVVIQKMTNSNDVIFGKTVSGRSIDLPGVESMLGTFTNAVPVRFNVLPEMPVKKWLKYIFDEQIEAQPFDQTPLFKIQEWSGLENQERLFESLLIFQNYNVADFEGFWNGKIKVDIRKAGSVSSYPLTLMIMPWDEMVLHILHDNKKYPANYANQLMELLKSTLDILIAEPGQSLASVLDQLPELPLPEPQPLSALKTSNLPGLNGHQNDDIAYIPPRNEKELAMTRIWETLFGRNPIGVTDNFFDIGGRSILAVRLFSMIDETFGRNLPPVTLLEHPTIEALTKLISNEQLPAWTSLVPIKAKGTKPPVYCIHAGGAHVLFYSGLAKYLDADQPVYALQPLGLDQIKNSHTSIVEMATHYLKEIRSVQPEGPYSFVSICYGNPINLELAKQLEKAGQAIGIIAIVDSAPGQIFRKYTPTFQERLTAFKERMLRNPFSAVYKLGKLRISRLSGKVKEKRVIAKETRQDRNLRLWQDIMTAAYHQYDWAPYRGKITLIRTSESMADHNKVSHPDIWSDLALGGVDVFVVEGHHRTIFEEPEVKNLAIQLQQCLDSVLIATV